MIEMISLDRLVLSDLNPRKQRNQAHIDALAESIRAIGLQQNLIGASRPGVTVEIVGGGTRLLAMQAVLDPATLVPVHVYDDVKVAVQAAIAENEAREAMHPVDAAFAYRQQMDAGLPDHAIGHMFGKPAAEVKRIAALTLVIEPVLQAYRADKIGLDVARAFHLGTREHQAAYWETNKDRLHVMHPFSVRTAMKQGLTTVGRDAKFRFVGEEAYLAAGGKLTSDLFAETVFIDSPDILDTLANAKLRSQAEMIRDAEGWEWCDIEMPGDFKALRSTSTPLSEEEDTELDRLAEVWGEWDGDEDALSLEDRADLDRYYALMQKADEPYWTEDQKAASGVVVQISYGGALDIHRGIMLPEHADALPDELEDAEAPDAPKPDYSAKLEQEMRGLQTAILQAFVATRPKVALTLLAWSLSNQGRFQSPLFDRFPGRGEVYGPTVTDSGEAQGPLGFMLTPTPPPGLLLPSLAAERKVQERVLAEGIAQAICGTRIETVRQAMLFLSINQRSFWTPDATFFGRLKTDLCKRIFEEVTGAPFDGVLGKKMKAAEVKDMLTRLFADPKQFTRTVTLPAGEDGKPLHNWSLTLVRNVDAWLPAPMRLEAPEAEDAENEHEPIASGSSPSATPMAAE